MNITPLNFILTVLGGLLLAGLLGWIRKPRLVVLVPRLFSYSHLTDRGQLAEITIFNRGFKTEESIELSLGPSLQYNIVGSSSQDVSLTKNKLTISRIGPGDDVTTLLLVEGGAFTAGEISNCLSKESKGRVVAKAEAVPPTGPQRIGMIAALIVLPLSLYAVTLALDYIFDKLDKTIAGDATKNESNIELQSWVIPSAYEKLSRELFRDFKKNKILLSIGSTSRKKDVVTVPISLKNQTSYIVKYTISMTTTKSEDRIPSYKRRISDIHVFPGQTSERSINVVIPANTSNEADKVIFIDAFFEADNGDTLSLKRKLTAE